MEIPDIVVDAPQADTAQEVSDRSSSAASTEQDAVSCSTTEEAQSDLGSNSLSSARLRGLTCSDTTLDCLTLSGGQDRPAARHSDDDDESEEDGGEEDSVFLCPHRRHTLGGDVVDPGLKEGLQHLLPNHHHHRHNHRHHQHHEADHGDNDDDDDGNSRQRVSLPKRTLQRLRLKIGNNNNHKTTPPTDADNSPTNSSPSTHSPHHHHSPSWLWKRQTLSVIPGYAVPKEKRRAVWHNDEAFNTMWRQRQRQRASLGGGGPTTSSSAKSRSVSWSADTVSKGADDDDDDDDGYENGSSSGEPLVAGKIGGGGGGGSVSKRTRDGAREQDEALKQERQSALMQIMLTEEEERQGHEPDEREKMLDGVGSDEHIVDPMAIFINELSCRGRLQLFLVGNPTTRLGNTVFYLLVKIFICFVYVLRVALDKPHEYACQGEPCSHNASKTSDPPDDRGDSLMKFSSSDINWFLLWWVQRPTPLWIFEVVLSFISIVRAVLVIFAFNKGHRLDQLMTRTFVLELLCSLPLVVTLFYPPWLQHMYVPTFLNCWLVKQTLERIFDDLHLTHQRFQTISVTLSQQMAMLVLSLLCLMFTTICGIQHIQRGSAESQLTLFESVYFVIVTFSTVGYGDISPDIWLGQAFILIMILVAFIVIPQKVEVLATTWLERKKMGGEYSYRVSLRKKHVVVCTASLVPDTMMDFLNEFYAHPKLETHMVILMCSQELDSGMQVILKDLKWRNRVIYMKGSALKDYDLERCRIRQAEACFFLVPRPAYDKDKADQHTILRSWAVKDFAPKCKQYIHLFKPENKMHVRFAEHVVCEDEFKYALLANNCLYPGLSTLVSVLIHTSSGLDKERFQGWSNANVPDHAWQKIYGQHTGNDIYHIQLCNSTFFSNYKGSSFAFASADAHERFGVTLLAVIDGDDASSRLRLNPGKDYILKERDYCFYMSLMREEYTAVKPNQTSNALPRNPSTASAVENMQRIAKALETYQRKQEEDGVETEEIDASVFNTITNLGGRSIARLTDEHWPLFPKTTSPPSSSTSNTASVATNSATTTTNTATTMANATTEQEITMDNNNVIIPEEKDSVVQPLLAHPEDSQIDTEDSSGPMDTVGEMAAMSGREWVTGGVEGVVGHRHDHGRVLQYYNDMERHKLTTGPPPVTIYMGSRKAVCNIMSSPRPYCCLHWGTDCEHCTYKNARDRRWNNDIIILVAQRPSNGIYHFLVPLRSSFIAVNGLCPIVLLLEMEPDLMFLDTIAMFPLVYWMQGTITKVDDLLKAGIMQSCRLVVVNRRTTVTDHQEEILSDSDTILAVQTTFRMFPGASIITELSQSSNMRFMRFSTQEAHLQNISDLERKLKGTPSNRHYMFRTPFAAGLVFSASVLDTLLYQTYAKGYLITFVRLLLGMDAEEGSGHLSSIRITSDILNKFPSYGTLYHCLCMDTGEIPIALYRTEKLTPPPKDSGMENPEASAASATTTTTTTTTTTGRKNSKEKRKNSQSQVSSIRYPHNKGDGGVDTTGLVKNRLAYLNMSDGGNLENKSKSDGVVSYVIANPIWSHKLRIGDIIYVIQPSSMAAKPSNRVCLQQSRSTCDLKSTSYLQVPPPAHSLTVPASQSKPWIPPQPPSDKKNSLGFLSTESGGQKIGRFLLQRRNTVSEREKDDGDSAGL